MKYLILEKTIPDGRTFNYHKIYELNMLSPDSVKVELGSWYDLQQMLSGGLPDFIMHFVFTKAPEQTTELFVDGLLEQIKTLPEWQAAELVDLSKPEPLPTEEDV